MSDSRVVVSPPSVLKSIAGQVLYDYRISPNNNIGPDRIYAGNVVYLNTDSNGWRMCMPLSPAVNASLYGTSPDQRRGIALNGGWVGQVLAVLVADTDFQTGANTMVKGNTYLGYYTGGFSEYAVIIGDNISRVSVGIASSNTNMVLNFTATGKGA